MRKYTRWIERLVEDKIRVFEAVFFDLDEERFCRVFFGLFFLRFCETAEWLRAQLFYTGIPIDMKRSTESKDLLSESKNLLSLGLILSQTSCNWIGIPHFLHRSSPMVFRKYTYQIYVWDPCGFYVWLRNCCFNN